MSIEEKEKASPTPRFAKGLPHYHRANRLETSEWDEWTGDRAKSWWKQKFESMFHSFATVIVGCFLLLSVLALLFIFWRKVLMMFGK